MIGIGIWTSPITTVRCCKATFYLISIGRFYTMYVSYSHYRYAAVKQHSNCHQLADLILLARSQSRYRNLDPVYECIELPFNAPFCFLEQGASFGTSRKRRYHQLQKQGAWGGKRVSACTTRPLVGVAD